MKTPSESRVGWQQVQVCTNSPSTVNPALQHPAPEISVCGPLLNQTGGGVRLPARLIASPITPQVETVGVLA